MGKTHIEEIYELYVEPSLSKATHISIPIQKDKEIKKRVREIFLKKQREKPYIVDPKSIIKRWYTGWGGEYALEIMLKEPFVDFTIGDSKDYSVADLSPLGIEVGVKTVNKNDFPLLKIPYISAPQNPQILIVKEGNTDFYICGLADFKTVNNRNNFKLSLVRSTGVLERGEKSAFYRFDLLRQFKSLEELKALL